MKCYVDFEASEAQQKIISVGCIREDGQEFYSLVHTDDPITPRITEITEITQAEIDGAKSIDEVFAKLYDWADDAYLEFICYGSGDLDFVSNTFYDAQSFKAASMLGYMYLNMYDCSEEIKQHFYVNKTISLEKLMLYFDPDFSGQSHNALDDAKILKQVYEHMNSESSNKANVFGEYLNTYHIPYEIKKVIRLNGDTVQEEFSSMDEAVAWLSSQQNDKGSQYLQGAAEKIKKAAKEGGKYFGSNWRIL